MKSMKTIITNFFILLIVCSFSSCVLVYAHAVREKTIEKKEWQQDDYIVIVESRQGGFGGVVNECAIYKKDFPFRKKVVEYYFSYKTDVKNCELLIIEKGYRYAVDVCKGSLDVFH